MAALSYQKKVLYGVWSDVTQILGMLTEESTIIYFGCEPSNDFHLEYLKPAVQKGLISDSQAYQLAKAAGVIRFDDPRGNAVFAVIEEDVIIEDHHRLIADQCAEILRIATGCRSVPFVVGTGLRRRGADVPAVRFIRYDKYQAARYKPCPVLGVSPRPILYRRQPVGAGGGAWRTRSSSRF